MRNLKIVWVVLIVAMLVAIFALLPVTEWVVSAYDWIKVNRALSAVFFVMFFVVWVLLIFPASLLVIASGFLYGFFVGIGLILLGHLIASTLTFLISRNIARSAIEKRLGISLKLQAIDLAIEDNGFSMVFLARLSMIIPYNLLNYVFGLTSVTLRDYVIASFLGMLVPFSLFTFLGTTADDLAAIMNGEVGFDDHTWMISVFGLVVLVFAVYLIVRKAKLTLTEKLNQYDTSKGSMIDTS